MADKRIHELATTTDKSGKFLALDEAGLSEALKFSADSLIDKAFTDTLYVKLAGNETVNGVKTWNNQGVFEAGILVNLLGIDVTGNSDIAGTLDITGALTVTAGGIIVTGASSIAGKLTISTGGADITGNVAVAGTVASTSGGFTQTLNGAEFKFSRDNVNYIRTSTVGGYLAFITNGVAASTANANLVLSTTQESYFNNNLAIGFTDPAERLWIEDTTLVSVLIRTNSATNSTKSGTVRFTTDIETRYAEIAGYRGAASDRQELIFSVYGSGAVNEAMRINYLGAVGIGTPAPTELLHIKSGAGSSTDIGLEEDGLGWRIRNDQGTNRFALAKATGSFDTFDEYFTVLINGNVGIGITNPTVKLDVQGDVSITNASVAQLAIEGETTTQTFGALISLKSTTDTRARGLLFQRDNGVQEWFAGFGYQSSDNYSIGYDAAGGQSEYLANRLFTILTTGNVGIGTDAPGAKLEVQTTVNEGDGGVLRLSNYTSTLLADGRAGQLEFYKSDASVNGAGVVSKITSYAFDAGGTFILGFHTGDSNSVAEERFTMSYLGSFLINNAPSNQGLIINTSSPKNHGVLMQVADDARWFIYANSNTETGSDAGSDFTIASYTDAGAFKSAIFKVIRSNGRIGMGDAGGTPSYALDLKTIGTSDTFAARFWNDGQSFGDNGIICRQGLNTPIGSTEKAIEVQDGDGTNVGSLAYDTTSGLRIVSILSRKKFKKNFRPAKGLINATAALKAAQPQVYNWKGRTPEEAEIITELGEDQKDIFGFVIDDIEAATDGIVHREPDPKNPGEDIVGISETGFIKYLVKAVEELSERLEALETP